MSFMLALGVSPLRSEDAAVGQADGAWARDVSAEIARVLTVHPELEPTSGVLLAAREEADESLQAARLRVRLQSTHVGSEIAIVLRDGSTARGELSGATDRSFDMLARRDVSTAGGYGERVSRRYSFGELADLEAHERNAWMAHDRVRDEQGERVELLLLDGDQVRGRLVGRNDAGVTLRLKRGSRSFPVGQVVGVRQPASSGVKTGLIVAGCVVVLSGVFVLGAYSGPRPATGLERGRLQPRRPSAVRPARGAGAVGDR